LTERANRFVRAARAIVNALATGTVALHLVSLGNAAGDIGQGDSTARRQMGPLCGVYCVDGALEVIGIPCEIRSLVKSRYIGSPSGSSARELCSAARDRGAFAETLVGLSAASLRDSACPLILHVAQSRAARWYNHWVLFCGLEDDEPIILDYAHPAERCLMADVLSVWDGTAIAVSRSEDSIKTSIWDGRLTLASEVLAVLAAVSLGSFLVQSFFAGALCRSPRWSLRTFAGGAAIVGACAAAAASVYHAIIPEGFMRNPSVVRAVCLASHPPEFRSVDISEVEACVGEPDCAIVDSRFVRDFAVGHIPGAISLPINSTLPERRRAVAALRGKKRVIIYCQSRDCSFAHSVAADMVAEGLEGISLFPDGWASWAKRASSKMGDREGSHATLE
jgi:rhodanese-related sulfurtransferase